MAGVAYYTIAGRQVGGHYVSETSKETQSRDFNTN